MAKSRLTIICNTQVHNMKDNLWNATKVISHSMELWRPKVANSMLNRVLQEPRQEVQQLLVGEEIIWMLWVQVQLTHNRIAMKLTLDWVPKDVRIVLGLPCGQTRLKFSRDHQEQIVTMMKVKNLQEMIGVRNCLQEKYYLDKKLHQEGIAWRIDLNKLHIWMLECNVHLEQILRLV